MSTSYDYLLGKGKYRIWLLQQGKVGEEELNLEWPLLENNRGNSLLLRATESKTDEMNFRNEFPLPLLLLIDFREEQLYPWDDSAPFSYLYP